MKIKSWHYFDFVLTKNNLQPVQYFEKNTSISIDFTQNIKDKCKSKT